MGCKYISLCVKVGAWATLLLGWDIHIQTQPSIGYIVCTFIVYCPVILLQGCKAAHVPVNCFSIGKYQLLTLLLQLWPKTNTQKPCFCYRPQPNLTSSTLIVRVHGSEGLYLCDCPLWVLKNSFWCMYSVPCHFLLGHLLCLTKPNRPTYVCNWYIVVSLECVWI